MWFPLNASSETRRFLCQEWCNGKLWVVMYFVTHTMDYLDTSPWTLGCGWACMSWCVLFILSSFFVFCYDLTNFDLICWTRENFVVYYIKLGTFALHGAEIFRFIHKWVMIVCLLDKIFWLKPGFYCWYECLLFLCFFFFCFSLLLKCHNYSPQSFSFNTRMPIFVKTTFMWFVVALVQLLHHIWI